MLVAGIRTEYRWLTWSTWCRCVLAAGARTVSTMTTVPRASSAKTAPVFQKVRPDLSITRLHPWQICGHLVHGSRDRCTQINIHTVLHAYYVQYPHPREISTKSWTLAFFEIGSLNRFVSPSKKKRRYIFKRGWPSLILIYIWQGCKTDNDCAAGLHCDTSDGICKGRLEMCSAILILQKLTPAIKIFRLFSIKKCAVLRGNILSVLINISLFVLFRMRWK